MTTVDRGFQGQGWRCRLAALGPGPHSSSLSWAEVMHVLTWSMVMQKPRSAMADRGVLKASSPDLSMMIVTSRAVRLTTSTATL